MTSIIATTVVASLMLAPQLTAADEPARRLDEAAAVISEIMATPDSGIPQDLLDTASRAAASAFRSAGHRRIW